MTITRSYDAIGFDLLTALHLRGLRVARTDLARGVPDDVLEGPVGLSAEHRLRCGVPAHADLAAARYVAPQRPRVEQSREEIEADGVVRARDPHRRTVSQLGLGSTTDGKAHR